MNNKQMELLAREHDLSALDAELAEELTQAAADGARKRYQRIEGAVVGGYRKIEDGVVNGYKKIENGVVAGFEKVTDKCVEKLFTREGESVDDAKKRLRGE